MLRATVLAVLLVLLWAPGSAQAANTTVVRFTTSLGIIDVLMLSDEAPNTVANFLGYVGRKDYDGAFFHRSVKDFIIQGGGYTGDVDTPKEVPSQAKVVNEFKVSNTRGTLAMAKVGSDPNSATNQWFFNENDTNAANLDNQNGGFTVFGRITDAAGLKVMDAIAALTIKNAGTAKGPFGELPVRDYAGGDVKPANIVYTTSVAVLPGGVAPTPVPPPAPTPVPTPSTPAPAPRPPAKTSATTYRLLTRAIDAPTLTRRMTKLRVAVLGLPARTKLTASITGTGRKLTAKATAGTRGGTARLTFPITRATRAALRRRSTSVLQVTVTATPPGSRASTARTVLVVRR